MTPLAKLLIGLAAAWLSGWISHAPLGQGAAFVGRLEADARAVVRAAAVPGVTVRFSPDRLERRALLAGPADDFQREGQGQFPGLNDRILAVPGVAALRWEDGRASRGTALPLLLETELLVAFAFLIGIGLGWRIFRPRRQGYL